MADVTCCRCGQTSPGLSRPPMPGPTGRQIAERVCAACWDEWLKTQVKFINEYRLNPLDERHFEFLVGQAREFLKLGDEAAS